MKTTLFLMMIAAALAIAFTNCSGDDEPAPTPTPDPELSVTPESIPAAAATGTYAIAVTSNTTWTVNSSATWSTPSPLSGSNNGAVTVTVAENTETTERAATVTIAAGNLSHEIAITQAAALPGTPPQAASTRTWTFGSSPLIWSDAIQIPGCDKALSEFVNSSTDPSCHSYTDEGTKRYYYNWPYVNTNAATLCPDPWRVPTKADFDALSGVATADGLIAAWGYSGSTFYDISCNCFIMDSLGFLGLSWSSTEQSSSSAYRLVYMEGAVVVNNNSKIYGHPVRCVK